MHRVKVHPLIFIVIYMFLLRSCHHEANVDSL